MEEKPSGLEQPPPGLPSQQSAGLYVQDQEHLKVLSICYYVSAGLSVLGALFAGIYMVVGGVLMTSAHSGAGAHGAAELQFMGGTFLVLGALMTLIILVVAVLEFIVAQRIVRRRSRVLCLVMAGLNCLNMPLGTALGVFTFIVLCRPQVAASFDQDTKNPGSVN